MISGHDTVLIAGGDLITAFRGFLAEWSVRWPQMRISIGAEFVDWSSAATPNPERGEILLAKDRSMEARWDEEGYFASDNEGPITILYEPIKPKKLKVLALEDPYDRDPAFMFSPYDMTVLCQRLAIVTLVLPEESETFRGEVTELLAKHLNQAW